MSRDSHLELKVGGFVLLGFVCLTYFVASVTNFSFVEKGYLLSVSFNYANGLKDAAPVRLAGVDAGNVKKISVFTDNTDGQRTKVRVNLWLRQGIQIPADSVVTINQLGLLGEKYVEIIPGHDTHFLTENAVLVGTDPVPFEKITERVNHLTEELEVTINNINNGLLSPKNQKSIEDTLADVHEVVLHIKEGQGTVGKLLVDDGIYRNLEELTADLKVNPWKLLYRPKK